MWNVVTRGFAGLAASMFLATTGYAEQTPDSTGMSQSPQIGNVYWSRLSPIARESILQHNGGNIPPAYRLKQIPHQDGQDTPNFTKTNQNNSMTLSQKVALERNIGKPPIGDGHWYICDATKIFYPWGGCTVNWRQVQPFPNTDLPPKPDTPTWADGRPIGNNSVFLQMYYNGLEQVAAEYRTAAQQAQEDAQRRMAAQLQVARIANTRKIDESNGYRYMSVSDFDLDKERWLGLSAQGLATDKWIVCRLLPRFADMGRHAGRA